MQLQGLIPKDCVPPDQQLRVRNLYGVFMVTGCLLAIAGLMLFLEKFRHSKQLRQSPVQAMGIGKACEFILLGVACTSQ